MNSITTFIPSALIGIGIFFLCIFLSDRLLGFTVSALVPAERMQSLDGLRGLLSMSVFIGHFVYFYYYFKTGDWGGATHWYDPRLGSTSVALFFMLTGFLFGLRLLNRNGSMDWVNLYISRLFRIVPLYWFMVAALAIIVYWASGADLVVKIGTLLKQIGVWLSFTNYPNINKYSATFIIVAGVVWTIKYEWLFYLSLPLQAVFVRASSRRPWMLLLLATLTLGLAVMPQHIGYYLLQVKTLYARYFLVGGISAWLYKNEQARAWARSAWASLIALGAILLAALLFHEDFDAWQTPFLAVFFIPIALGNSLFGLLTLRVVRYLGDISYGIYLLHGMVIFTLFGLLFPKGMDSISTPIQFYLALTLTGLAVVAVCSLTYFLIEKPFIRIGKMLTNHISPGKDRRHA